MNTHQPIYALRKNEVFESLESCPEGLSADQVRERLDLYGQNNLKEQKETPIWRRLAASISHPLALLLWLAGAIILFTGQPVLAGVIWMVVAINASFSFYREYWAERAVTGLRHVLPVMIRVIREGQDVTVPVGELVPGDVLVLAEGDRIPADARVVEEYGLRVNNATLTGEAMPVRKTADASLNGGFTELERPNLIFAGTTVVSGTANAVVYATGMMTQFGRIANLTQSVPEAPSQLQLEMNRLSRVLSFIALIIGVIVLIVASGDLGLAPGEALILAIGTVVAVIPEGLSPTVTLSLAIGVQRLALKGVLVKKLSILETLGKVSVICTDKSGTLTQNQMTVNNIWVGGNSYYITGIGYEPVGKILSEEKLPLSNRLPDLDIFLVAAMLCNNARLHPPTQGQMNWSALGDQTEVALLAMSLKGDVQDQAKTFTRVHELPFDARRKRMSTIHCCPDGKEMAFVKGSPKEVLQLCTHMVWHGSTVPLTNELSAKVIAENDGFARQALRVVALATRGLPQKSGGYTQVGIEQNLTFLGLAAMMDPPRPEVARAIAAFQKASIRMAMITGDYGLTAESLARRIGMITGPSPKIITGADLELLDEPSLLEVLGQEIIFARMAPEHKMRLVAAYQKRGEVVAVIGDGVNDAPALRKADIGIAMGMTGTDVAREAADIILTHDNFELIVRGIEEGRAVYDNLRKFMTYILASNVPEILPFLLTALFNLPLVLTVIQILIIDLGTDILPALALGMEKPEPDILNRPPRNKDQPLLDKNLLARSFAWLGPIEAMLCYAGFLFVLWINKFQGLFQNNFLQEAASLFRSDADIHLLGSTVFLAGVIIAQIGNAFACRSENGNVRWLGLFSNRPLLAGIAVQILLLLGMIYIEPVAMRLGLTSLPLAYWIGLVFFAPILYGIERTRKRAFHLFRSLKIGGTR